MEKEKRVGGEFSALITAIGFRVQGSGFREDGNAFAFPES